MPPLPLPACVSCDMHLPPTILFGGVGMNTLCMCGLRSRSNGLQAIIIHANICHHFMYVFCAFLMVVGLGVHVFPG